MRLTELDPHWVSNGGEGVSRATDRPCKVCNGAGCDTCHRTGKEYEPAPLREKIGLSFLCPCAECTSQRTGDPDKDFHLRVFVAFTNPVDGGPPIEPNRPHWHRRGETFDDLVLQPSILSVPGKGGCGWHGYVGGPGGDKPGEVVTL